MRFILGLLNVIRLRPNFTMGSHAMEALEVLDLIGVKDAIKKSFSSVFGELNLATEAWFQKTRLLTIGRDNYADYVATKIGVFPLFATNRSASVDTSFVSVDISTDIERDRYRSRGEIERGLERVRRGEDSDLSRRQAGMSVLKSITSCPYQKLRPQYNR